jgi:hypothetical protein
MATRSSELEIGHHLQEPMLRTFISVGFEVLTAVVMKGAILRDITPCSPLPTDVSEDHIASIFRVEK